MSKNLTKVCLTVLSYSLFQAQNPVVKAFSGNDWECVSFLFDSKIKLSGQGRVQLGYHLSMVHVQYVWLRSLIIQSGQFIQKILDITQSRSRSRVLHYLSVVYF